MPTVTSRMTLVLLRTSSNASTISRPWVTRPGSGAQQPLGRADAARLREHLVQRCAQAPAAGCPSSGGSWSSAASRSQYSSEPLAELVSADTCSTLGGPSTRTVTPGSSRPRSTVSPARDVLGAPGRGPSSSSSGDRPSALLEPELGELARPAGPRRSLSNAERLQRRSLGC